MEFINFHLRVFTLQVCYHRHFHIITIGRMKTKQIMMMITQTITLSSRRKLIARTLQLDRTLIMIFFATKR